MQDPALLLQLSPGWTIQNPSDWMLVHEVCLTESHPFQEILLDSRIFHPGARDGKVQRLSDKWISILFSGNTKPINAHIVWFYMYSINENSMQMNQTCKQDSKCVVITSKTNSQKTFYNNFWMKTRLS